MNQIERGGVRANAQQQRMRQQKAIQGTARAHTLRPFCDFLKGGQSPLVLLREEKKTDSRRRSRLLAAG